LSPATIWRIVDRLVARGLVVEGPPIPSSEPGRQAASLQVAAGQGVVCGVDLGATNCRVLAGDLMGRPVARRKESTRSDLGTRDLGDWIADLVLSVAAGQRLSAVAVGVPGMVGTDGATISGATNLPTVNGKGLAERIRRRLRVPVGLHNDANVALLGEMRYGAARHLENAAMVTVGTGLGASVALDGKLVVGHTGLVGEIGFIPVGANGETLEDFLSGSALVARVRSQARKVKDAAEVFSLPHSPVTSAVLEEFWRSLLLAFAVLAVSYEPETIIIGGGLAPTISPSLPRLETQLGSLLPTSPRLVMTQLGDLGGAFGAVVAACQLAYVGLGIDAATAAHLPASLPEEGLVAPAAVPVV
jgi:predicted NBD/HSP70 family sugar kinase